MNDFMEFAAHERNALKPSKFELWAAKVEKIIGHDLDGDQQTDGYSLDYALDAFNDGLTPAQYAAAILSHPCSCTTVGRQRQACGVLEHMIGCARRPA